jgi:hypothetical protein
LAKISPSSDLETGPGFMLDPSVHSDILYSARKIDLKSQENIESFQKSQKFEREIEFVVYQDLSL